MLKVLGRGTFGKVRLLSPMWLGSLILRTGDACARKSHQGNIRHQDPQEGCHSGQGTSRQC